MATSRDLVNQIKKFAGMQITMVLMGLREYAGWSVPLLFCMQQSQVFSSCSPNTTITQAGLNVYEVYLLR